MSVDYEISWRNANERLFDVVMRFTAPVDDPQLHLAAWRPGRYLIQNFAVNVREWSASAPVVKSGKSAWRISAKAGDVVTMRYRYYAGILDAGSCFLDPDEAYVNPSNLLMMVPELRGESAVLTLTAPAGWKVETQLPVISSPDAASHELRARDYDHLIDSPLISAATLTHHAFDACGATIHLVFRGDEGIDTAQYIEPVRAIVREQAAIFGGLPLRDYRFLFHVSDKWHGVEHEESCSIIVRRDAVFGAKPGDEGYDHLLSIVSHEFFHLWNVKRIVPAAFAPYDYSTETPTRLLWAMEGLTSYFGDRSLARTGLWDEKRYLEHLAKEISTFESSAAGKHLPLSQASFDGWLMDPSRPHDRGNAWYSFYNKGEIVGALLDLALRSRSGRTLDEVFVSLWREYGEKGAGLEEDAVRRAVISIGGDSFSEFFDRYVDRADPLPYEEILASAGLACRRKPQECSLGAKLRMADGAVIVDAVPPGSTAAEAGLMPNDELIAVGAARVRSEGDVQKSFRGLHAGDAIELTFARAGVLRRGSGAVRLDPAVEVEIAVVDEENALRREWLRRTE